MLSRSGRFCQSTWQLPPVALGAAFDDVAGDGARGQLVVILGSPAEAVNHGREGERRVGATSGDHDIGSGIERFSQRERSDIRVRCQDAISDGGQGLVGIEVTHCVTFGEKLVEAVKTPSPRTTAILSPGGSAGLRERSRWG